MIEKLFRDHFWIFGFLFLVCASYLMAQMAGNALLLALPSPSPVYLAVRTDLGSGNALRLNMREAILDHSNLFDPKGAAVKPPPAPPPPPEETPEDKAAKAKPQESCPADPKGAVIDAALSQEKKAPLSFYNKKSELPIQLKGTVISSKAQYSLAAILDAKTQKVAVLRAGEMWMGLRVCGIDTQIFKIPKGRTYAYEPFQIAMIDQGRGRLSYLRLGDPPGKDASGGQNNSYYQTYNKLRNTDFNTTKIERKNTGEYVVPRDFITQATDQIDVLASQAAILPYFHRGEAAGFTIQHIRPGSFYQKIGITNGDVITRINGYQFTSPQKALEAYSNLLTAKSLQVDVLRNGKVVNMRYEIKE